MTDHHEYVFMSIDTLKDLSARGEATYARGFDKYAYYQGKRVLTTSPKSGLIPDGEIWSEPIDDVRRDIRGWLSRLMPNFPVPDCIKDGE